MALLIAVIIGSGLLTKRLGNSTEASAQKKEVAVGTARVLAEVAETPEERAKGLAGRAQFGESEGMLFVLPKNSFPSFWMKDMKFPIDIIWVDEEKVVKIHKDVQPEPEKKEADFTLYRPDSPVDYVLEVTAGFSDKNSVKVGDKLEGL